MINSVFARQETQAFEEFRSFFQKSVGVSDDEIENLIKANNNIDTASLNKIKKIQQKFIKGAEAHLGKVINRFQSRGKVKQWTLVVYSAT